MSQFWRPIYNTVPVVNNTVLHTYLTGGSLVKYSYHNRVKFKKKKKRLQGNVKDLAWVLEGQAAEFCLRAPLLY